jgi:hypothetical protein
MGFGLRGDTQIPRSLNKTDPTVQIGPKITKCMKKNFPQKKTKKNSTFLRVLNYGMDFLGFLGKKVYQSIPFEILFKTCTKQRKFKSHKKTILLDQFLIEFLFFVFFEKNFQGFGMSLGWDCFGYKCLCFMSIFTAYN